MLSVTESVPDMRIWGQLTCLEICRGTRRNIVDCVCICIYMSCHESILFTCMKVLRLYNSC
jgi:hypothetical protein